MKVALSQNISKKLAIYSINSLLLSTLYTVSTVAQEPNLQNKMQMVPLVGFVNDSDIKTGIKNIYRYSSNPFSTIKRQLMFFGFQCFENTEQSENRTTHFCELRGPALFMTFRNNEFEEVKGEGVVRIIITNFDDDVKVQIIRFSNL